MKVMLWIWSGQSTSISSCASSILLSRLPASIFSIYCIRNMYTSHNNWGQTFGQSFFGMDRIGGHLRIQMHFIQILVKVISFDIVCIQYKKYIYSTMTKALPLGKASSVWITLGGTSGFKCILFETLLRSSALILSWRR